jgi:predicted transcriptional regulator
MEMACLAALWTLGEGTVREVADAIAPRQRLAYTTVMTLLERLVRRNHLVRRKAGRRFIYAPAQDPATLRETAIAEFASVYFGGSREALRDWLNRGSRVTPPAPAPAPGDESPIDTALL